VNQIERGLYAALTSSTALTSLLAGTASVYNTLAPANAVLPYVVFQKQSNVPVYTNGGLAYENAVYMVKGVVESPSKAVVGEIASRINTALTDQPLTVTGYKHLMTRRISDIDYSEVVAGKTVQHAGASFRIAADPN
jgi:hypothetical protein